WPLFCLFFFSVSKSKLPGYVLPAFPAIALLLSAVFVRVRDRRPLVYASVVLALVFFLLLYPVRSIALHEGPPKMLYAYAAILLTLAFASVFLAFSEFFRIASAPRHLLRGAAVCCVLLCLFFVPSIVHAIFRWDPSGRSIAGELKARNTPLDRLTA